MRSIKPILFAEDDDVDQEAVKRCFEQLRIANPLIVVGDGEQALAYLQNDSKEKPCLILLDLKMPKMDGIELLRHLKVDKRLKLIPVVMFTSSAEEQDKVNSYNLGVAGYIVKPPQHREFLEAIRTLDLYWTLNEVPPLS